MRQRTAESARETKAEDETEDKKGNIGWETGERRERKDRTRGKSPMLRTEKDWSVENLK
jgi:hypothetical protein